MFFTLVLFLLKLPLDLSPLATPIIRNKTEEATATEAHRDSPLPHPESTTNDDKVKDYEVQFMEDVQFLYYRITVIIPH